MVCAKCVADKPPSEYERSRRVCKACRRVQKNEARRTEANREKARLSRATPEAKAKRAKYAQGYKVSFEDALLYSVKARAKKRGLVFDITVDDLRVPDVCPVFGTPLDKDGGIGNPNMATLDRIDPSKGYVPGNVWIVSWRANKLKSDASLDDLRALVDAITRKAG